MPVVATGFWVDYGRSSVLGATLTLRTAEANFLLTTLTFITTIAFACMWHIMAFVIHHLSSSRSFTDALDLQHRVLLRNQGDIAGTIVTLVKLYLSWKRRHPRRLFRRTLRLLLPCIIILCASISSTIFISKVVNSNGSAVRVMPNLCGLYSLANTEAGGTSDDALQKAVHWHLAKGIDAARRAKAYVSEAYMNGSTLDNTQPILRRKTLPYTISVTAPCPFSNATRCGPGENAAVLVSSGMIDSDHMLGINAPPKNRVSFQQNMTCSPLQVDDLITVLNSTIMLDMGRRSSNGNGSYPDASTAAIFLEPDSTTISYSFSSIEYYSDDMSGTWLPTPEFQCSYGDQYVLGLNQFNVRYAAPVYDAWFSATRTVESDNGFIYAPDRKLTVMGCNMYWTICNPAVGLCTPAAGMGKLLELAASLPLNTAQNRTVERILNSISRSQPARFLSLLEANALLANDLVAEARSPGLPITQWQTEVLSWFLASLTMVQADSIEYAAKSPGFFNGGGGHYALKYPDDEQCRNQLISSTGEVQNYSVLALSIILTSSLTIIIASLFVERLADCTKRPGGISTSQIARQADDKFHLLRMALRNSKGHNSQWELGSNDVPVTRALSVYYRPEVVNDLVSYQ